MLTLNVTYHCKSGQRDAFYQALCDLGVREVSIHEEGCLRYDYFYAAEHPNDLLLVETWADLATHEAHRSTETFAKLQAMKPQFCDSSDVLKVSHD